MNNGIPISGYLRIILSKLLVFLLIVVFFSGLGVYYAFSQKEYFRSDVIVMVISDAAEANPVQSIATTLNIFLPPPDQNEITPVYKLIMIFNSRILSERMAENPAMLEIAQKYHDQFLNPGNTEKLSRFSAAKILKSFIAVEPNEVFGTLMVSAIARDPSITKPVVLAYVEEAKKVLAEFKRETIRDEVEFISTKLLASQKDWLTKSTQALNYLNVHGVSPRSPQVSVDVTSEINAQKSQQKNPESFVVKNVPQQVHIDYLNKNLLGLQKVIMYLQYEYLVSRFNEAKPIIDFKILDQPLIPDGPFKPDRKLIITLAIVSAILMALPTIFIFEYFTRKKTL